MKLRFFLPMGVVALLLAFVSCTNDISEVHSNELKQIVMTASDFETENGSRTNFQITNAGAEFSWAANDTVGIFPNTGAQAYFPMTSGAGTKSAKFDGGGWALKNASTYGSYYPFIADFYLNKHAIPVDYTGQAQTGDASTAHLGAYDFMAAAAASPKNGNVTFAFKHLGALIQLKLTLPQATTLKSVTLTAADDVFSVKGKVDIMASTLCIEPVTSANELTLTLKDVATTEANQVVTLYMMLPPANLSEQTLKAVVTTADKGTMEMALESKNFQAGKAYGLSGVMESGYRDGVVTLTEAGTMKKLLGNDYLNITSLKVVGPINGDDVYYLRKMIGCHTTFNQADWGKLSVLDLSEATIIEGGGWYYENSNSNSYYTSNNVIGDLMFANSVNLQKMILPNTLKTIGKKAFLNCDALSSVIIGNSVVTIDEGAFKYCYSLDDIDIPDSVTSIGNSAFYDCDALTSIDIPDNVVSIGEDAFYGCESLMYVNIGDGINAINKNTFAYCKALSSLQIGDNVTIIGESAFQGCSSLPVVNIPNSVVTIDKDAFRYCSSLTSVDIPDNVTTIGSYAFYSCNALSSVVIGNGLKWIDSNTFAYCESLSTVVIGNGVVRIGDYAFYYCRALTSVTIGENVTELNNHAFYHCDAIKEFYCNAVMPPAINTGYEATFASAAYGATLYVPIRCSSKYSSSDWGKYFKSIKEFD